MARASYNVAKFSSPGLRYVGAINRLSDADELPEDDLGEWEPDVQGLRQEILLHAYVESDNLPDNPLAEALLLEFLAIKVQDADTKKKPIVVLGDDGTSLDDDALLYDFDLQDTLSMSHSGRSYRRVHFFSEKKQEREEYISQWYHHFQGDEEPVPIENIRSRNSRNKKCQRRCRRGMQRNSIAWR